MNDFLLMTAIEFDDGTVEGQVLHRGTREECERVQTMIPGVSYSGPKNPVCASVLIRPAGAED